jgi:hypothetical protein
MTVMIYDEFHPPDTIVVILEIRDEFLKQHPSLRSQTTTTGFITGKGGMVDK